MSLSKAHIQTIVDELDRQMRDAATPKRGDDPLAKLALIVGRNLGGIVSDRSQPGSAASVKPGVSDDSFDENEPNAKDESSQDSVGSVDLALDDDEVGRVPDTSDFARRALERRSFRSPRALAFVVSF